MAATSMARPSEKAPGTGQRSASVSMLPPVPTSRSTLPELSSRIEGTASAKTRSTYSARRLWCSPSTGPRPSRNASTRRTVPTGSDRVKAARERSLPGPAAPPARSVSSVESASDVDQDRGAVPQVEALGDGELDQPRLLRALDDVDVDPRLPLRALDEQVPVLRLARGAGGDGAIAVHLGAVHGGAEAAQRLARGADDAGLDEALGEHVVAEAHRRAVDERRPGRR